MSVMSNDPSLPGRHRCRLCGTRWRCACAACAGPQENTTLLCIRCDASKAEVELSRAKSNHVEARRTGRMVEMATERLQAATARAEHLRVSLESVYGGFTAMVSTCGGASPYADQEPAGWLSITLTPEQIEYAESVGTERKRTNRQKNVKDKTVMNPRSDVMDRRGAVAEYAASLILKLTWNDLFTDEQYKDKRKRGRDVGRFEVRESDLRHGCLLIQSDDDPDAEYLLALSYDRPTYHLVGGCFGRDGQQSEFWRTDVPQACFFVPQRVLVPAIIFTL